MRSPRSDHNALLGLAIAAPWALYSAPTLTAGIVPLRQPLGIRDRIEDTRAVALSFDDGPHPEGTPAVLELLDRSGAQATFFLVGEQVERRPTLAAEIAAAGHEIALHCHRHRSLLRLTPRQLDDDLRRALVAIGDATGRAPRLYRPPYGYLSVAGMLLARRRGWQTVLWRRDGRDWQAGATAASIASRLIRHLRGGDVLLMHDADYYSAPGSWRNTAAALPLLLEELEWRRLATSLI
jgi:peptidoglycan/xylan/chitin deacetylase (PgdA/CDA1 family)